MTLYLKKFKIESLSVEEFTQAQNDTATQRLEQLLKSWEGTRYWEGQCQIDRGVDCVHFIASVYDSLTGSKYMHHKLPQDVSFHNKAKAEAGLRAFFRMYPCSKVEGTILQSGDIIICGPTGKNGGPGHGMIVGADRLWHVGNKRVCKAGMAVMQQGPYAFKQVRRLKDRSKMLGN